MLGEAYDPSADYMQTLHELWAVFHEHGDQHAAQLEPHRRFLAVPLAPMIQLGASETDVGLVLALQETTNGDHTRYTAMLDHRQNRRDGLRETYKTQESTYTTDPDAQEFEVPDPEDEESAVYTHEDWRQRIGAAVTTNLWSIDESWFWVPDNDPSPLVRAAIRGDRASQKKLRAWRRQKPSGGEAASG